MRAWGRWVRGERKRVAFKESEIPSPPSGLQTEDGREVPWQDRAPGVFGEEVAGLGGDYSAPESCSPAPAPLLPSDLSPSLVTEAGLAAGRGCGTGGIPFTALPTPRCPS